MFKDTRDLWHERGIENMAQYLEWYNKQDLTIMVSLIRAMQDKCVKVDPELEIFRDVSLAKHGPQPVLQVCFHLPKGNDEWEMVERTLRMHMAGGPSIIFEPDHWAHVTSIHGHPEEVVKSIETWNANALYPRCMMNDVSMDTRMMYFGPQPKYHTEEEQGAGGHW